MIRDALDLQALDVRGELGTEIISRVGSYKRLAENLSVGSYNPLLL